MKWRLRGTEVFDQTPIVATAAGTPTMPPEALMGTRQPSVDWSRPPSREQPWRPNPTRIVDGDGIGIDPVSVSSAPPTEIPRAAVDPTPAEVIPVLEMLDILKGPGGTFGRVSAKARRRELDRIALEHMHAGEPFIYLGRRFPGANE